MTKFKSHDGQAVVTRHVSCPSASGFEVLARRDEEEERGGKGLPTGTPSRRPRVEKPRRAAHLRLVQFVVLQFACFQVLSTSMSDLTASYFCPRESAFPHLAEICFFLGGKEAASHFPFHETIVHLVCFLLQTSLCKALHYLTDAMASLQRRIKCASLCFLAPYSVCRKCFNISNF